MLPFCMPLALDCVTTGGTCGSVKWCKALCFVIKTAHGCKSLLCKWKKKNHQLLLRQCKKFWVLSLSTTLSGLVLSSNTTYFTLCCTRCFQHAGSSHKLPVHSDVFSKQSVSSRFSVACNLNYWGHSLFLWAYPLVYSCKCNVTCYLKSHSNVG